MSSRVKLSMISNFAAVAHAPWTAATITFADAEIVRTGKSCPKRKRWKTKIIDLILACGNWWCKDVAYHHSQCRHELLRAGIVIKKDLSAWMQTEVKIA